jgi:hypothetical protein
MHIYLASNIQINVAVSTDRSVHADVEYVEDSECNLNSSVGYDGQHILRYWEQSVSIVSEYVIAAIVQSNRKTILTFWGVSKDGLAEMGHCDENLFWEDLKEKRQMSIFPLKQPKILDKDPKFTDKGPTLVIPECQYLEDVQIDELENEVFNVPIGAPVIAHMKRNEPLIDFAGPYCNVYQVTVSDDHDLSLTGLKQLFISSGHCEECNDTGILLKAKNADSIKKIKFY